MAEVSIFGIVTHVELSIGKQFMGSRKKARPALVPGLGKISTERLRAITFATSD